MENPFEEQQNQFQHQVYDSNLFSARLFYWYCVFLPLSVVVGELYPIYFLYLQPD